MTYHSLSSVKTYKTISFIRFEALNYLKFVNIEKTKIIHSMILHEFKILNNKLQLKYKNASNLLVLFHYIMTIKRGNELHATLNAKCIYFYTSWKLRILSVEVYWKNIRFIYVWETMSWGTYLLLFWLISHEGEICDISSLLKTVECPLGMLCNKINFISKYIYSQMWWLE